MGVEEVSGSVKQGASDVIVRHFDTLTELHFFKFTEKIDFILIANKVGEPIELFQNLSVESYKF